LETRIAQLCQLGLSALLALSSLLVVADHAFGTIINPSSWLFAGAVTADLAEGKRNVFGASTALCLVALAAGQALRTRGVVPPAPLRSLAVGAPAALLADRGRLWPLGARRRDAGAVVDPHHCARRRAVEPRSTPGARERARQPPHFGHARARRAARRGGD